MRAVVPVYFRLLLSGSTVFLNGVGIDAYSARAGGSVRERAIAPNAAKSFSPIANSIACRHAAMSSTLSANQSRKPRTHVGNCESPTYDRFHGIDVVVVISDRGGRPQDQLAAGPAIDSVALEVAP